MRRWSRRQRHNSLLSESTPRLIRGSDVDFVKRGAYEFLRNRETWGISRWQTSTDYLQHRLPRPKQECSIMQSLLGNRDAGHTLQTPG